MVTRLMAATTEMTIAFRDNSFFIFALLRFVLLQNTGYWRLILN